MPAINWGIDSNPASPRPTLGMAPADRKDLPGLFTYAARRLPASDRPEPSRSRSGTQAPGRDLRCARPSCWVKAMTDAHLAAYGFSGGNGKTGATALICVGYTTTALPLTYCVITGKARMF